MEWIKVSVTTTAEGTEHVAAFLDEMGIGSVEIIDPSEYAVFLAQDKQSWDYVDPSLVQLPVKNEAVVIFYLSTGNHDKEQLASIRKEIARLTAPGIDLGALAVRSIVVNDEDWLHKWKDFFTPIRVGRVDIVPDWEAKPSPPAEVTFVIDPGSAFGTGQHATTYLCVDVLQNHLKPGQQLLDVGCGSGILAVIGLLLGASSVVACDIDASAITATHKNATLNAVDGARLEVLHGNILTDETLRHVINGRRFNVVIANIVADVVLALLPMILDLLTENGLFIASGIIDGRDEEVLSAFKEYGYAIVAHHKKEGWHCLVCGRIEGSDA